jgi:drug/metabolite transporter (DMT)-like permease
MAKSIWHGIAAGAAGTTALNLVTYLDMALRGRPQSTTPEQTVRKAEQAAHLPLASDGPDSDTAENRRSGLGALLGIATGLGSGLSYALVRPHLRRIPLPLAGVAAGLATTVATAVPMAATGVSDPRTWSASAWLSDLVPHLAYGLTTAAVFDALDS